MQVFEYCGARWIRAEDAPDIIEKGTLVLFQHVNKTALPQIKYFDPDYDRRTWACGGWFYMKFSFPKPPEMNHDLPDRTEP